MEKKARCRRTYCVQMAGCYCLFFLMMLGVLNRSPGFTDESDNFIGGMVLASGGNLYEDFVSQHMPVMYVICAVLKLLGADGVYGFRLAFYAVLAGLWTAAAVFYKDRFGLSVSAGSGVLYITNMFSFYTCCILAEQVQAVCFVVLLMEFLRFAEDGKIGWRGSLMLSAAVFLSFGSAFVSAFPVFAIALAFLAAAVQRCMREKTGFLRGVQEILGIFWRPVLAVLAPFLVLLAVYAAKGTLSVFWYSAYTVNREIYPNYISGYGSSILQSFAEPVKNYAVAVRDGFAGLFLRISVSKEYLAVLRSVLCYLVNIIFWIDHGRRKNAVQAVLIAYFTMMCGTRGFTHEFHSLPYIAVTMFMAAYLISEYVKYVRDKSAYGEGNLWRKLSAVPLRQRIGLGMIVLAVGVYAAQYAGACRSIIMTAQNLSYRQKEDETNLVYWIDRLTEEEETVLLTTIEPQLLVEADRIPYRTGISAPWMYEAFRGEEMETLEKSAPRVAVYSPDYSLWGYALTDYAPEFAEYMSENYTQLDGERFPELYIRNDYLETAEHIYAE